MTNIHAAVRMASEAEDQLDWDLNQASWICMANKWVSLAFPAIGIYLGGGIGLALGCAYTVWAHWYCSHHMNTVVPASINTATETAKVACKIERKLAVESALQSGMKMYLTEAWERDEGFNKLRNKMEELHKAREAQLEWEAKRDDSIEVLRQIVEASDDVLRDQFLVSMSE